MSPDGSHFASAGLDHELRLWNIHTDRSIVVKHPRAVTCVVFSVDGRHIAYGDEGGEVTISDAHTSVSSQAPYLDHNGCITSLVFSHDKALHQQS